MPPRKLENQLRVFYFKMFKRFIPIGLLLIVVTIFVTWWPSQNAQKQVRKVLRTLSHDEKTVLKAFFQLLLFESQFAYVLYGDKPAATIAYMEQYNSPHYGGIRYSNLARANSILREGWRIWEQRKDQLPLKNYLLHHHRHKNRAFVHLINKRALKLAFNKNRIDFVARYGSMVTFEKVLSDFLNCERIHSYHELMGIILGYGRKNARLFQERENLEKRIITHSLTNQALIKKVDQISKQLKPFDLSSSRLHFMSLPQFAADSQSKQTQHLKKKYRKQRKEIAKELGKGDFLEMTLIKLMQ